MVKKAIYVLIKQIYKFKGLDDKFPYQFYLGIISKDFRNDEMKEITLNVNVYEFSIDYRAIDTNNVFDIHNYFIKT